MLISANRNLPDYARYGYPVLRDAIGPIRPTGGYPRLCWEHRLTICWRCPPRYPFLPADLLEQLWQMLQSSRADLVYARAGSEPAYSAICLMRRTVLDSLTERLASQELRLGSWYAAINAIPVDLPLAASAISIRPMIWPIWRRACPVPKRSRWLAS